MIFFLFGVMGVFDWSITKTNTHPIDNPEEKIRALLGAC
jgi:hypothetical protein